MILRAKVFGRRDPPEADDQSLLGHCLELNSPGPMEQLNRTFFVDDVTCRRERL